MTDAVATLSERWTVVDRPPPFGRVADDAAPLGARPIVHVHVHVSGGYLVLTAERLAPFRPSYVPNPPGYGRSRKPKRPPTMSANRRSPLEQGSRWDHGAWDRSS